MTEPDVRKFVLWIGLPVLVIELLVLSAGFACWIRCTL